jgi:lipid-A-disaccharide synthase
MNCLIIAGEKSGEEHALSFLDEIKSDLPSLNFFGVGGDELKKRDVEIIYHLNDFSSWGISEVIFKIPFYRNALNKLVSEVEKRNCKVAILIDFQTFNMKLAKMLSERGIKVLYYVAPQAWAWKSYRAKSMAKIVDILFSIIPFEKEWFGQRGLKKVVSVEHPVYTKYKNRIPNDVRNKYDEMSSELRVLILPGSRNFEVEALLPEFMNVCRGFKKTRNVKIGIVPSPSVKTSLFSPYLQEADFIFNQEKIEEAFDWAHLSLAASGTITLMTAVFQIPTIVAYDGSLLNEFIFKTFVNYSGHVSLANIIHEDEIFPELLMENATTFNMTNKIKKWLENRDYYDETIQKLANTGKIISGETPHVGRYMANMIKEYYAN